MCEHIVVETEDKIIITTFKGETLTARTILDSNMIKCCFVVKEKIIDGIKGNHEMYLEQQEKRL